MLDTLSLGGFCLLTALPSVKNGSVICAPGVFPQKRDWRPTQLVLMATSALNFYAAGQTVCDACGKLYHVRARLLAHLYDCQAAFRHFKLVFPRLVRLLSRDWTRRIRSMPSLCVTRDGGLPRPSCLRLKFSASADRN